MIYHESMIKDIVITDNKKEAAIKGFYDYSGNRKQEM